MAVPGPGGGPRARPPDRRRASPSLAVPGGRQQLSRPRAPRRRHGKRPPRRRDGFAQLGRFGLSFDAWAYHIQLPDIIDLVRAFPDTTVVVDHFAGPLGIGPYAGRQDEVFAGWRQQLAGLAALPNAVMKLGGI